MKANSAMRTQNSDATRDYDFTVPNHTTRKAMEELEAGTGLRAEGVEALLGIKRKE